MAEAPDTGVRPADTATLRGTGRTGAATGRRPAVGYARLTGVLGVAFAVLLAVGLVLRAPLAGAQRVRRRLHRVLRHGGRTVLVTVGLYLVPFAGIAFLWHMTTIRLLRPRADAPNTAGSPRPSRTACRSCRAGIFVALLFCRHRGGRRASR